MGHKSDIIFIYPTRSGSRVQLQYGFGSACLIAYLRQQGFSAYALVQETPTVESFVSALRQLKPRIVGFTCYDSTFHLVRCLALLVNRMLPTTSVVVGGPTATYSGEAILNAIPEVDVIVQGEGELSTEALVHLSSCGEELRDNDKLRGIRGITYRDSSNYISTGRPNLISDLEVLPSPVLAGVLPPDLAISIGVMLNRGCNHHCVYCAFAAMNYRTVRGFSADRLLAELEYLQANSTAPSSQTLAFIDDNFLANKAEALRLCQLISARNLKFNFFCQVRSELASFDVLSILREANFTKVAFGLESVNPYVLDLIKKNAIYAQKDQKNTTEINKNYVAGIISNVFMACDMGMKPVVSAMVGLPGETRTDALALIELLKSLPLGPGQVALNPLYVACGTELFRRQGYFNVKVENVGMNSVDCLFKTNLPKYVDSLPIIPNSISYIQARSDLLLLKERIQSKLLFMEQDNKPDFVFVTGLNGFMEVVNYLDMSSCVYIINNEERGLHREHRRISRYLIKERIPISILRQVHLLNGDEMNQEEIARSRAEMKRIYGPIQVVQFREVSKGLKLLEYFGELDFILLVCSDTQNLETLMKAEISEKIQAIVALSAFPLAHETEERDGLTLSEISAYRQFG